MVDSKGNNIYFFTDVNDESVLSFNILLKKLERRYDDINVYIHSNGGELWAGISAMDHIRMCKSHVTTIADGICASAATLILLGGKERQMTKNSYVLIHQLSTDGSWDRYTELKEQVDNYDKFTKNFKKIYKNNTDIPLNVLEQLFTKDIYWSSKKCIKYGVVDEVI
jgi:ATP-dependent Clp endopeptidase proteolytic subunit ClpP